MFIEPFAGSGSLVYMKMSEKKKNEKRRECKCSREFMEVPFVLEA